MVEDRLENNRTALACCNFCFQCNHEWWNPSAPSFRRGWECAVPGHLGVCVSVFIILDEFNWLVPKLWDGACEAWTCLYSTKQEFESQLFKLVVLVKPFLHPFCHGKLPWKGVQSLQQCLGSWYENWEKGSYDISANLMQNVIESLSPVLLSSDVCLDNSCALYGE